MTTTQPTPQNDAPTTFQALAQPRPFSELQLLRDLTRDREGFTLQVEPPIPSVYRSTRHGQPMRTAHKIATLAHTIVLVRFYVDADPGAKPLAFYDQDGVTVAMQPDDRDWPNNLIVCTLQRDPGFRRWLKIVQESQQNPISQATLVRLIRDNAPLVPDWQHLVGCYDSLRGELTHDATDRLDHKSREATFVLRRGKGSAPEVVSEGIPMQFVLRTKILLDDSQPTEFIVTLDAVGSEGGAPKFIVSMNGITENVQAHIDARLEEFSRQADFPCVRGTYCMEALPELGLPKQAKEWMESMQAILEATAPRIAN